MDIYLKSGFRSCRTAAEFLLKITARRAVVVVAFQVGLVEAFGFLVMVVEACHVFSIAKDS